MHRLPGFRYLLRRTHDASRAEELIQEAFLRLCRRLHEGRTLENLKAWLFTVANNLTIDTISLLPAIQDLRRRQAFALAAKNAVLVAT